MGQARMERVLPALSLGDEDTNPLARIFEAFDNNQFEILRNIKTPLTELKILI